MRLAIVCVLAAGAAGPATGADVPAKTVKADELSDAQMEAFLSAGQVVRSRNAGSGVTGSVRVTLRHEGVEHDAHVQSVDLRRPIGGMSGGDEIDFRDSYRNNVAAYRLDRLLGLGMVPVTVVRAYDRKTSAFTWWVDDVAMTELDRRDKDIPSPDPLAWNRQMWVVRIFDQLIYNFDRNLGNLLVDKSWRIWMIDHTRAFKIFKEPKSPQNLATRCPRALLDSLRRLDRATLDGAMKGLLTPGQITGLLARRDFIVRYFDARIAELGEKETLYDLPARLKAAAPGPP